MTPASRHSSGRRREPWSCARPGREVCGHWLVRWELWYGRATNEERRKRATYPELQRGGGQCLFVLAVEVGGRWNADSQALVRQLVRVRALRAPPALRAAASSAWTRRWWGMMSTAVQHAVGGTALGAPWLVSKGAAGCEPALDHVLALAEPAGPSRLPLR